jgi:hypothetical protein
MTAPVAIRVADYTDGPFAVSVADGERLRERVAPLLRAGTPVVLFFTGIEVLIGAFVRAALGPLCADFPVGQIEDLLNLRDITSDGRCAVERAMRNARAYYANPAAYDAAWAEEMGEEAVLQEVNEP